ncbi:DivIVA domain-containing protein [Kitasatospora sp. NPDC059571]|uniref:DivIVA domain-containing protein n=1 Tax=Kitasatospora sp. NPDC059571 TaxID=3346871 RepID=UPI0036C8BF34
MPLTIEAFRAKEFTTVRLRHGYRQQEVDEFLDEVEEELSELIRANEALHIKLASAVLGGHQGMPAQTPFSSHEGSSSDNAARYAQRILELAQQAADEEVAAAHREAEAVVIAAQRRAHSLEAEARSAARAVEQRSEKERCSVLATLAAERSALEAEIGKLRAVEREYRSQVKSFLDQQLHHLDSGRPSGSEGELAALTSGVDAFCSLRVVEGASERGREPAASAPGDASYATPGVTGTASAWKSAPAAAARNALASPTHSTAG